MSKASQTGHPPDFRVRYRFLLPEEGGRQSIPFQDYRSDFSYDGGDPAVDGILMIHPEFESADGSIFPQDIQVPREGTARMWILLQEMREDVHRKRIRVGVRGYFMEGSHRVAEAEVIEVLGLHTNVGRKWRAG